MAGMGMWDPRGSRADLRTGAQGAPTGITGGGSLGIDSSDLQTLHARLGTVISDVGKLDAAVQKLASSLTKAGGAWTGIGSGKATAATGGGNLSTGSFGTPITFGGAAARAPIMGAGGGSGGGGNRNTSAPVSAFGGGTGRMIALGAMGEVGAQMAGSINSGMNTITSAGMATDLMASQSVGILGGGTKAGTVNGMTGFGNMGPKDLNTAIATLMANPRLFGATKQGSQQQKGLQGFGSAVQKLNPGMSAAMVADTANQLASGPALQAMQRFIGNGKGLINLKGGINDPNQVFSGLLQTVMGGKKLSAAQMKGMSGNSLQATQAWSMITQNNSVPGLGLGLSPQMLTELRQYAAAGGNLSTAEQRQAGTVAGSALFKTTAKTKFQETAFQKTSGEQITENKAAGDMYNMMTRLTADGGPLPNLIAGAASAAKYLLSIGSHGAGALVLAKGAQTLFGHGASGIAGAASSVMGGGSGGGPPTPTGSNQAPVYVRSDPAAPFVVSISSDSLAKFCGCAGSGGHPKKTTTAHHAKPKGGGGGGWGDIIGIGSAIWSYIKSVNKKEPWGSDPAPSPVPDDAPIPAGDPSTGSTTTAGMTPTMSSRMNAMMKANPAIKISSGHRTTQQQKNLYALKGGKGVAAPGHSAHQMGKAADIGPPSQFKWIAKNAQKFGLYTPAAKSEPWHVQAMGDPTPSVSGAGGATGSAVVNVASAQLGTPYVWGGETAGKAFDCSGLVQYVFSKVGINLPRTSQQQATVGKAVNGLGQAQAGDLILYNEPGEGPNSHVAIYIGGGKQIAAPHTGTVVQVQSVDTAHISTIRRVVSGGAGHGVVAAAQQTVGQPANDSHASGGSNIGLGNNFLSMVSSLGGMEGTGGSVGGGGGGGTTGAAGTSSTGAGATTTAPSSGTSLTVPASGTMSAAQVMAAWIKAGGPPNVAKTMAGIAMAESGDQPGIVQKGQPYSTTGWGLWQITPGNSEPKAGTDNALLDPVNNAKAALMKYQGAGNTLRPWNGDHYLTQNHINPDSSGMGDPVGPSFAEAFSAMGDPPTSSIPSSSPGMSGSASFNMDAHGGGGNIYVSMPIQMTDGSSGDAARFGNQVIDAIERRTGMRMVQEG